MQFQLVHAKVALAGDLNSVVYRGPDSPLTYPEYLVLEFIHGPGSLMDVCSAGYTERSIAEERKRLRETYSSEAVDGLFGKGEFTPLPTEGPELPDAADLEEVAQAKAAVTARKRASAEAQAAKRGNMQFNQKRKAVEAQKELMTADEFPDVNELPSKE